MIKTLDRYILRQIILASMAMIGIALIALLLERLLRLLDLAANPDRVIGYISQMLVTLIPHYLGVALPLAFFLGVLLTFNRLSRDNELAVMTAAGAGLRRLMFPVMGLALVLTAIAAVTLGFLEPLGRYTYRLLVHEVAHASLSAAVREGTFVHTDGITFITEDASPDGKHLSGIFVYEETEDGGSFITTASDGTLHKSTNGLGSVLVLTDGQRSGMPAGGGGAGSLAFSRFQWPLAASADAVFRARGKDERELTLPELWAASAVPPAKITAAEATAEMHARLVNMATILILPLLAVPLALGGGRGGQSYGIVIGMLILVVYEKVVKFGESMADLGHVTPWFGLWLPFAVFAMGAMYLWYRVAFKVPKGALAGLPTPAELMTTLKGRLGPGRRRPT